VTNLFRRLSTQHCFVLNEFAFYYPTHIQIVGKSYALFDIHVFTTDHSYLYPAMNIGLGRDIIYHFNSWLTF